jgi:short-subunit dehydrogenase
VNVVVVTADLSQPHGALDLHAEIVPRGLTVDLLVNNAGFGLTGPFLSHALREEEAQVQVNVTSLMVLTNLFAPAMAERSRGGIINIASLAAFQPQFNSPVYAAGKSLVLLFSEALWLELAPRSVHVLAVCPGPVVTGFFERIGSKPTTPSNFARTGGIRDLASFRQEAGRAGPRDIDDPHPSLGP